MVSFLPLDEKELTGEVAIGSGETRSMGVLAEILSAFRQQHPKVSYCFYSGNADYIKKRIENGTLDIGLLLEPVDISRYEFLRISIIEEWYVLTREDSLLGTRDAVCPEDLAGRPLMVPGRDLVQNELANWLGEELKPPEILIRFNRLYSVAMLVKSGFGDALTVRLDCTYPGAQVCSVRTAPPVGFCFGLEKATGDLASGKHADRPHKEMPT